jgi:hypothetical protein
LGFAGPAFASSGFTKPPSLPIMRATVIQPCSMIFRTMSEAAMA